MFSLLRIGTALLFMSLLIVGCDSTDSDDDSDDNPPVMLEATLSSIQTNIFTQTCATAPCHDGTSPQRGLDLTAGASFASLVNVASMDDPDLFLVNPSNADSSYLIWKLEGNPLIAGNRMPNGGPFLTTAEIDVVRQWIDAGALNN